MQSSQRTLDRGDRLRLEAVEANSDARKLQQLFKQDASSKYSQYTCTVVSCGTVHARLQSGKHYFSTTLSLDKPELLPILLARAKLTEATTLLVGILDNKGNMTSTLGCPILRPLQPKLDTRFREIQTFKAAIIINIQDAQLRTQLSDMLLPQQFSMLTAKFLQTVARQTGPSQDRSKAFCSLVCRMLEH